MAWPRAGPGGKAWPISPSAQARTAPAPTPDSTRPPTNTSADGAQAQTTDPAASTTSPPVKTRRRPVSSASAPLGSSATARPSAIALSIHGTAAGPADSAVAVRATVASGVTKETSTARVLTEASTSVRPCSTVRGTGGAAVAVTGRAPASVGLSDRVDRTGVGGMCKPCPVTVPDLSALPGRACSIAGALEVVGDRWALLCVREVSLGAHRFTDIVRGTGAPRDRLTARLNDLVAVGVLERRPYSTAPPRSGYHLTASGKDLLPVLQALLQWGDRWVADEPPVRLHHAPEGHEDHRADLVWVCRTCGVAAKDAPVRRVAAADAAPPAST